MTRKSASMLLSIATLFIAPGAWSQDADELADAREQVQEAVSVVNQMKADPDLTSLMKQARGIFIIPDYAKAAAVVGGQGGEGVVVLRENGQADGDWSAPAFFDFGGGSIGAEVGIKAGSIAMLLMSQDAVDMFMTEDNNWSLDANAGLTIVNYSAAGEASTGKGDVILWSETEGAYVGADIGISDINRDQEEIAAFYGSNADARQIFSGEVSSDRADRLRDALSVI